MTSGTHNPGSAAGFSPTSTHPSESPPEQHVDRKRDSKRRRNPLSCAECRRLKLRCDRVFPCESCRKRGCAAICPDGALTTKGTRFVLANTEELHDKIIDMSERIRQLEEALAASHPSERHPLLREDLLLIKVPIEFRNERAEAKVLKKVSTSEPNRDESETVPAMMAAFGTLKLGSDGYSRFFGQTARTEHFLEDDKEAVRLEIAKAQTTLPSEILQVSQAFPFGSTSENNHLTQRILTFLPPYHVAWPLVDNYYSHAAFVYVPCQRQNFTEDVLKHVYDHNQNPERLKMHRLALVFAVLAHAVLADLTREPYSPLAEQFQLLSRASLAMTPLLAEPSIHAIQALHLLALYSALSNKPDGGPAGWVIQGLNVKLAVALGLHRDLEYWGGGEQDKDQLEVRRWVFWEIVTLDGWLSLGLGRPSTLHLSQIDCKWPEATERGMGAPDGSLHVWHTWKHGHAILINRVLQKTLDTKAPPYSEILDLDRAIHRYTMPQDAEAIARGLPVPSPSPEQTPGLNMQRALFLTGKYTAVLLLHRAFFAQALSERNDPMQSKYAPSVMATYRSACLVIMALHYAYERHPELTCRYGLYWSNTFSASISLCLLVTRATKSSYAPLALDHLDLAYDLIRRAAPDCYPAGKTLPMARKLYEKAHAAFAPYGDGQHPASMVSRRSVDNDDEELSVLGGKTNVVSDKPSKSVPAFKGLQTPRSPPIHPDSPGIPVQMPQTSHLDSVHPSLVQYVAESHWASDMRKREHPNQPYVQDSSAQQFTPAPTQQHASFSQQQHQYANNANISPQQGYHTYPAYPSESNVHLASAMRDNLPPDPRYVYYDNDYPPGGQGLVGPGQPEIHQPQPQNQYATWQTYVQQLYN